MPESEPSSTGGRRHRGRNRENEESAVGNGENDQPMLAELFSVSQLERHARRIAGWHETTTERVRGDWLLERLADNENTLADANRLIADAVRRGRQITPAAEWFLDNFHLIEEQIRTAQKHLPSSYNRELPRLSNASMPGAPRVYHLALELISHAHGRVDDEGLRAFVAAYQEQQPLKLGELWAIPIMLRLALIENLRRVVMRVTAGRREREQAASWVAKMVEVAGSNPEKVVLILADLIDEDVAITDSFAAEFATRLQGHGPALVFPLAWLEQRLAERSETVEHVFELATQSQAADQVAIGNSIGSMRYLAAIDWRLFVEAMSVVEKTLRTDPAAAYATMDFGTRDQYRHVVEAIAKRTDGSEETVARAAIELARTAGSGRAGHVGYFLIDDGRPQLERAVGMRRAASAVVRDACRRRRFAIYAGAIVVTTLACALAVRMVPVHATGGLFALWSGLLAVCASQLAIGIVHWATTLVVHPRLLPRLDFSAGIPVEHRTMVAVPTLLSNVQDIDELVEALEVRFLANRDPNLSFALITDFRDAATETTDGDAALIARAVAGIEGLNAKYRTAAGEGFFLFHRNRTWNKREGAWMGWERKRGKLEELNAALRGEVSRFATVVGPVERLPGVKYVIALDSDTQLPRESARLLAATLAHPLNRPCYDEALGRVTAGYTILQPRVGVSMASTAQSRFARWFGGDAGIDPYTRAVSDIYQDVFAEGSFIGKGIYDVDSFQRALHGRLPENRILSHDLIEGAYARSALVSDVLIVEDFPTLHATDVSRRYRWIRGDWQLITWLFRRVPSSSKRMKNPISLLSQWKVLDNLRRSLVPIALLAVLVIGWLRGAELFATLAVCAVLVVPALLTVATMLARPSKDRPRGDHVKDGIAAFVRQLGRELFSLACIPYDAVISLEAILRTALRLLVTRRKLLQWRTMSDAHRGARTGLVGAYISMWTCPVAALGIGSALVLHAPEALILASPVLALWLIAPAISAWLSAPVVPARPHLSTSDVAFLGMVARRTWRFFETYVSAEDNWLPPDNFQEDPPSGVAHRTSPTNIGLSLLANLTAYDFGYLPASDVIARITATFATLDRMQRYRGHFYNWYDTVSLEPLRPMYVSTVDSGNLTGHLLTLASGLEELETHPVVRAELVTGLVNTLDVAAELLTASPEATRAIAKLRAGISPVSRTPSVVYAQLQKLAADARSLEKIVAPGGQAETTWWALALVTQCAAAITELTTMLPWLILPAAADPATRAKLDAPLTLRELARLAVTVDDPTLREAVTEGTDRAVERIEQLRALAVRCREISDLDYEFLYDRSRHLLSIGYNVADHRLDASFYDLLASEARLASFVAIAQSKLPQEHWFSLGRQLTTSAGGPALLSWSGSMFEYLMPLLVMPTYDGTLLDATYHAAVDRQIAYGRERGVPWGVSESGYNKTDAQLNYQYRAFGVPGLGFKRGLADDLVIAPYASAMALMVAPEAATANLRRLAAEGRIGPLGFYEAVDYTPARLGSGKDSVTIASYMAHHQGMSFLSLSYVLHDRPMQRRFEAAPAFRATELLLQERVPRSRAIFPHPAEVSDLSDRTAEVERDLRVFSTPNTPFPEVHLLSNGTYHVAITNAGGGYSRWRELAVTRWHEDATRDAWGTFGYLRDVATDAVWSVAHQPTLARGTRYEAIFTQGRAEFRRHDADIETHGEIAISPEDAIELRRVTLTNRGSTRRTIELTSYAEVVLATAAADAAHPAFSNLFVQTELLSSAQAILCTRRPRSGDEKPPWMVHLMTVHGTAEGITSFETSRAAFVGRGRTVADPDAMHRPYLTNTAGSVLDPIVAIRRRIVLEPEETARFQVVTGVAETREAALGLLEKYGDRHAAERVLELSWTHSQVLQRRLDVSNAETRLYERLASSVLYANPALRAPNSLIARNRGNQSGLWAYAISGDLPIVVVRIADIANIEILRQLVKAHAYWRLKGLSADLVVWNEDPSGYRQVLQDEIMSVIASSADSNSLDRPGGIFVRRSEQISEQDKVLIQTVARVIISDSAGTLLEQVERARNVEVPVPLLIARKTSTREPSKVIPLHDRPDLVGYNGHGGFTPDGREYVITTSRDVRTPAPWVNVLANPWFGTVVSESGSAYTWCENAHSYRLTPWHNDAVSDTSGEVFYLRDEEDGHFWSPTPLPVPTTAPYTTRHGFGYGVFEALDSGISSKLSTYVAVDAPVKFVVLELHNRSGGPRRISVTGMLELVLGTYRAANAPHIVSELDTKTAGLMARNVYNSEFSTRVAFLDCGESDRSISGDRLELIGRNGSTARPAGMLRPRLSGRVGAALDPCLAMQVVVELEDGETQEIAFTIGSGRDLADARTLVQRFRGTGQARIALEAVWAFWNRTLGAINVQTPDPYLNFLANGWLVYQTLACRMWGRSGFYQSGGAYGFRDQLQDSMALLHAEPKLLREQIVRSASRQFPQGDVQHWWHPPLGRGVRTHISDDYLWLPFAVARYVGALGDTGVLDEKVPFIEGRPVKSDEDSYYDLPVRSDQTATVYEHCRRAIANGLQFGVHGLPLMGSGDWNDGMNLVGEHGKGESVWLAFFLYDVLIKFSRLAANHDDALFAERCTTEAATLRANIEQNAWDGAWYRRAYFDDGTPLGSSTSPECQIDSLPQSWALLSGAGEPERVRLGLDALDKRLVRPELGVIQLFDPPFDTSDLKPGYIKGYVPGVRENGGQYTHAAVWAAMAFAAAGRVERAWQLFDLINPVRHGDTAETIAIYKVEPYVVAADVYTNPQHAGRGGWTWYTGSAGWMYQLITESLLGIRIEVDRLRVEQKLPPGWTHLDIHYRYRETVYHIHVADLGGPTRTVTRVRCDGAEEAARTIPLRDDRVEHHVEIEIGG
ncbi:glucoamylase family protein [soil metagenome]